MRKVIHALLDSTMTGYQIETQTGVRQSTISDLRRGKFTIDRLPFSTTETLYKFWLRETSINKKRSK
ncbi:hypothetical protein ERX40_10895 [Macrococcus carouselicus]|uniref:Uncharacterized protein n=1 Tax=Macrococcus carouselicus TaxID=69969 RepID=A0A9Q8FPW8_9STAP|nr:hypothetical protein ERX40_10895 [Macrococcus carouselicus]